MGTIRNKTLQKITKNEERSCDSGTKGTKGHCGAHRVRGTVLGHQDPCTPRETKATADSGFTHGSWGIPRLAFLKSEHSCLRGGQSNNKLGWFLDKQTQIPSTLLCSSF